jgi:hypothetical protein
MQGCTRPSGACYWSVEEVIFRIRGRMQDTPNTTTTTARPHMGWPPVHHTPPTQAPVASRVPPPTPTINQASTSMCQQCTHAPRVGTALLCPRPVSGCTTTSSSTSQRLLHIRRLQPDRSLIKSQLRDIGAVYCPKCSNLKSVTGRGHCCPPTTPQMPQPPDSGSRQTEFQTPEPGLIPSPNTSSQLATPPCTYTPGWASHPGKSDCTICCTRSMGAGNSHPHQGHHLGSPAGGTQCRM